MSGNAAFDGIASDWANATQQFTEADPIGVVATYLVAAGNMIGPGPHIEVSGRMHHVNENLVLVGPTATGRKGDTIEVGLLPHRHADPDWHALRIRSRVRFREGIVKHVRDDPDGERPVDERRLLMKEGELASILAVAGRDGSTLSSTLRNAWDGMPLENHTKSDSMRASNHHISIVSAITPDELRRRLTATDLANGFANRFLFLNVARRKLVSRGGAIPEALCLEHGAILRERTHTARKAGRLDFTRAGGERWDHAYEHELSIDRFGMAGAIASRAEAHTLRLSMLYAILDGASAIDFNHVESALALWRYCEQSVRDNWGDGLGWPTADKIVTAVRERGRLTGTELRDLFGRHAPADLAAAIEQLVEKVRVLRVVTEQTGGRPVTVYFPCDPSDISDQRSLGEGLSSHKSLSSRPEASRCGHDTLWKARDGVLRCLDCEPPVFPAEVVA